MVEIWNICWLPGGGQLEGKQYGQQDGDPRLIEHGDRTGLTALPRSSSKQLIGFNYSPQVQFAIL